MADITKPSGHDSSRAAMADCSCGCSLQLASIAERPVVHVWPCTRCQAVTLYRRSDLAYMNEAWDGCCLIYCKCRAWGFIRRCTVARIAESLHAPTNAPARRGCSASHPARFTEAQAAQTTASHCQMLLLGRAAGRMYSHPGSQCSSYKCSNLIFSHKEGVHGAEHRWVLHEDL